MYSVLYLFNFSLKQALLNFRGVKRRFSKVGSIANVRIFDDYGHHPVEIAAVLKAARLGFTGNIIAVVQPHRYSRLRDLFTDFCTCFNDADMVIVTDVYAAGEAAIAGVDKDALVAGIISYGHRHVMSLPMQASLAKFIDQAISGDYTKPVMVICLGAGNITQFAAVLEAELLLIREAKIAL